jgi:hypothetical protein
MQREREREVKRRGEKGLVGFISYIVRAPGIAGDPSESLSLSLSLSLAIYIYLDVGALSVK